MMALNFIIIFFEQTFFFFSFFLTHRTFWGEMYPKTTSSMFYEYFPLQKTYSFSFTFSRGLLQSLFHNFCFLMFLNRTTQTAQARSFQVVTNIQKLPFFYFPGSKFQDSQFGTFMFCLHSAYCPKAQKDTDSSCKGLRTQCHKFFFAKI